MEHYFPFMRSEAQSISLASKSSLSTRVWNARTIYVHIGANDTTSNVLYTYTIYIYSARVCDLAAKRDLGVLDVGHNADSDFYGRCDFRGGGASQLFLVISLFLFRFNGLRLPAHITPQLQE
jgi:hypothetical protein